MRVTLCMLLFLDVMTVSVALHQVSFCFVFLFLSVRVGVGGKRSWGSVKSVSHMVA